MLLFADPEDDDAILEKHGVSLPNCERLGLRCLSPRGHGSSAGCALKMVLWMCRGATPPLQRLSVAHLSEFDGSVRPGGDGEHRANQGAGTSCGTQRRREWAWVVNGPYGEGEFATSPRHNLVSFSWKSWRSRSPSVG